MRYGVCAAPEFLPVIARSGVDYIECTVTGVNELSPAQFSDFLSVLKDSPIRCEAMSILYPGTLPLVGGEANIPCIREYLRRAFERVGRLAPEIVVFGSGRARMCPEGFNRDKAFAQLVEAARVTAEEAAEHNITIAFEPLNKRETNMIHTLAEARQVAEAVAMPNFKLLADLYHMLEEDEPASAIALCGDWVAHVHIAAKTTRDCPKLSDKPMFEAYFQALKVINYNKRISIEGRIEDYAAQLPEAFALFDALTV